ncbi:hypothetical protein ABZ914_24890 [Spirillospora sp. NPDC046719]
MTATLRDLLEHARTADRMAAFLLSTGLPGDLGEAAEQDVIAAYEAVLQAAPLDPGPDDRRILGIAADLLGLFYKNRRHGDEIANRRQALRYMNRALRLLDPDAHGEDVAAVHVNLGNLYGRPVGGRDRVAEPDALTSIRHIETGLEILTRLGVAGRSAADLHDNLSGAYARLTTGDRLANLLKAFEHSRTARSLYPGADDADLDELACLGNALDTALEVVLLARRRMYAPEDGSQEAWLDTAFEVERRTSELFPATVPSPRLLRHLDRIGHQFGRWAEEVDPFFHLCAASWYLNAARAHSWLSEQGFQLPQTGCYLVGRGAGHSLEALLHGVLEEDITDILDLALTTADAAAEPAYRAEALFLRARYHLLHVAELDQAVADARAALAVLPPESWEGVAHAFDGFFGSLSGLHEQRPDLLPPLRATVREVLPRWEHGTMGWARLSMFAAALDLYCVPDGAPPEEHIAAVRAIHADLEGLSPYISPLVNREIWSGIVVSALGHLVDRGITDLPDEMRADAEHALLISLVVTRPEWPSPELAGRIELTPLSLAQKLNAALGLSLDLHTPPPDFALAPSVLTVDEMAALAAELAETWTADE